MLQVQKNLKKKKFREFHVTQIHRQITKKQKKKKKLSPLKLERIPAFRGRMISRYYFESRSNFPP